MPFPIRKHPRLKNYDYGQCGCYHITICTKNRSPFLSRVIPPGTPEERACVCLSRYGSIAEAYIRNISEVYHDILVDKYVIMPNHIHLLLSLEPNASTSIPTVVRSLKRMVTREIGQSIWQDSYYDVVIRNEAMYQCEWKYIDDNPDKWADDTMFVAF